jgi:methionine-gamma-lyase
LVIGRQKDLQRLRKEMLVHLGRALSPFNGCLILRGLATLPLRIEKHCQGTMQVARFLENHPRVERVIYPGLGSHPQHDLAPRQMTGFVGMLAFQLKGGLSRRCALFESRAEGRDVGVKVSGR